MMPPVERGTSRKSIRFLAFAFLLLLPVLLALVVSRIGGPYSWDDGAITLAFGRTLFESGEFALTALSPRVEGSSSLLYAVLNGGLIHGLGLGFYGAIDASRIVSAVFLGATSVLLFHILQQYVQPVHAFLASLLYCLLPINYLEVFNGMEMGAFGFLLVLYFYALQKQSVAAFAILPFVLLIRIEAGFYLLVVLALASWLSDGATRARYLKHFTATVLMLAALQLFRVIYFHSFLPNTVLAKTHFPYSRTGMKGIALKIKGLEDFLKLYVVPAAFILGIMRFANRKMPIRPDHLLILAFALFALLSGRNWGYDARMTLALLAPIMVAVAASGQALSAREDTGRIFPLPFILVLLTLFAHTAATAKTVREFFSSLHNGAAYIQLAEDDKSNLDPSAPYDHGVYGITPENYKITGETVLALAGRLALPEISFAVPDVGGLGLCCDAIAVIDTALLTNPVLARDGYEHFDDYLAAVQPDVIETHGPWSSASNIYEGRFFRLNYTPFVFRNTLLYLRHDHIETLLARNEAVEVMPKEFNWETVRYGGFAEEEGYLASVEAVIHLP